MPRRDASKLCLVVYSSFSWPSHSGWSGLSPGFVREASERAELSQGVVHYHGQVFSWPHQNAHRAQGKKWALSTFHQSPAMRCVVVVWQWLAVAAENKLLLWLLSGKRRFFSYFHILLEAFPHDHAQNPQMHCWSLKASSSQSCLHIPSYLPLWLLSPVYLKSRHVKWTIRRISSNSSSCKTNGYK